MSLGCVADRAAARLGVEDPFLFGRDILCAAGKTICQFCPSFTSIVAGRSLCTANVATDVVADVAGATNGVARIYEPRP